MSNNGRIIAGTISAKELSMKLPVNPTVNWNPNEYKIKHIDFEKGKIIFERAEG